MVILRGSNIWVLWLWYILGVIWWIVPLFGILVVLKIFILKKKNKFKHKKIIKEKLKIKN